MNRKFLNVSAGVAIGLALLIGVKVLMDTGPVKPLFRRIIPLPPLPVQEQNRIRVDSWNRVDSRLASVEGAFRAKMNGLVERRMAVVDQFVAERKRATRSYAEVLLGWRSKYLFVRGQLSSEGKEKCQDFIREKFDAYVFSEEDLKTLIASNIEAFATELQGAENQLLIQLRVDVSEAEPRVAEVIPALQSNAAFTQAYAQVAEIVLPLLASDLRDTVGREAVSLIGGQIAAQIAIKVVASVAVRLGASTGILSAGAASGVVTLGMGMVAAIAFDQVLDVVLNWAGYDPAGRLSAKVDDTLDTVGAAMKESLRTEMGKLCEVRIGLRHAALKQIFLNEGGTR